MRNRRGALSLVGTLLLCALAACGGASSSPDGGSGAGGAGGSSARPCVDVACAGACVGDSCGGEWICDPNTVCSALATQFCGCDGKTFTSNSCSNKAFAHRGSCEAGVSCDPSKILCKRVAPICPDGQVPSVEGSCYGPCVPTASCTCATTTECPSPGVCQLGSMRCR